jgi:hypothetical protein
MYTPKISEALIPRVYRAAKEAKVPMTKWVDRAVELALAQTVGLQNGSLKILNGSETKGLESEEISANQMASICPLTGSIADTSQPTSAIAP